LAIFLTGGTGYIGSYVLAGLLERSAQPLLVLARKGSPEKLWRSLQLHLEPDAFEAALRDRVTILDGDLTQERFGLGAAAYERAAKETTSVVHIAASLNRKSEKACMNVNLRGTLEVIRLAQAAPGLERFSHVSTVAVAGQRKDEVVTEDEAIDWDRSDYDPYARTKKFCEHMITRLLPDVRRTIFRPSVVLGDSRRPETTQFDMVKAFVFLARLKVLPLRAEDRIDIVPVDYVSEAIVTLHLDPAPGHGIYHLSSGEDSLDFARISSVLAEARGTSPPSFWSWLESPFVGTTRVLSSTLRGTAVGRAASRLQVFMPYLTFNTVFGNARVVEALGRKPEPFSEYAYPLFRWSLEHDFAYPYREYPAS